MVHLVIETPKDNLFEEWMFSPTMAKEVEIKMIDRRMERPSRKIRLSGTYLIYEKVHQNHNNQESNTTSIILSPDIYEEKGTVFNKGWNIGTLSADNTVIENNEIEEGEEEMQVPIDIYIDSQTGHRFSEIKSNTETYRIIHDLDYTDVLEEYSSRINSKEAIDQLKTLSKEVEIDDKKIQMMIQKVDTNSRISEFQMYIVLERNWIDPLNVPAKITGEEDQHTLTHEDGEIKMNLDTLIGKNGNVYYKSPKGNLVIGQVHGHNKAQKSNFKNLPGTSITDRETAAFNGFNIYAIESYKNKPGGQAVINRVDGVGKESLNIGVTIGHSVKGGDAGTGKGTINLGKDAIDFYSKNPRKE